MRKNLFFTEVSTPQDSNISYKSDDGGANESVLTACSDTESKLVIDEREPKKGLKRKATASSQNNTPVCFCFDFYLFSLSYSTGTLIFFDGALCTTSRKHYHFDNVLQMSLKKLEIADRLFSRLKSLCDYFSHEKWL